MPISASQLAILLSGNINNIKISGTFNNIHHIDETQIGTLSNEFWPSSDICFAFDLKLDGSYSSSSFYLIIKSNGGVYVKPVANHMTEMSLVFPYTLIFSYNN